MKKVIVFLLFAFLVQGLWAQNVNINVPLPKSLRTVSPSGDDAMNNRKIKFQTGGNFNLQIGNPMGFCLQPKIGVLPVDWLMIGANISYTLRWYIPEKWVGHTFGANPFVEAYLFQRQFIIHAGYEWVNYQPYMYEKQRTNSHVVLVGAGYRTNISAHSSMNFLVLLPVYQYNGDGFRYYSNWYTPQVRIGYNYTF